MSLLNDALRAAEQRQQQPQVSAVYTGNSTTAGTGSGAKAALLLVLVSFLVFGAGVVWWFISKGETVAPALTEANVAPAPVPEDLLETQTVAQFRPNTEAAKSSAVTPPESVARPVLEAVVTAEPAVAPEPATIETVEEPVRHLAEPTEQQEPATPEVAVAEKASAAEPEPAVAIAEPEPAATPARTSVKQPRETPEAIDLRTSRELASLLASGRNAEAEQLLASLTESQPAPNSREVVTRDLLVQGKTERALGWLPTEVTDDYAGLRLLRARALLELGQLEQAVATLSTRVPAVADQPEYRITLATLLQQAGQTEASAGHWAELIAYDDSRPAWWLGLAIALETGGRSRSAVQAYAQAAALPGLSPALADYARERLNALQAGS
ncbi:MSHA biogenesis protein MshN [Marinobacter sp. C1S70]|uniref:tetratricopeptide repeat protein n=1 Tax=Marinobacter sp. C1S70 TaxID=1396859 RepID=UPI0003B8395D|nr:tetratricopeptide repeat protein [Marinobacter sp. C1S70]ERS87438.1 MSHA biogenesis protein MshN [Marinobacter sp. C1S70]